MDANLTLFNHVAHIKSMTYFKIKLLVCVWQTLCIKPATMFYKTTTCPTCFWLFGICPFQRCTKNCSKYSQIVLSVILQKNRMTSSTQTHTLMSRIMHFDDIIPGNKHRIKRHGTSGNPIQKHEYVPKKHQEVWSQSVGNCTWNIWNNHESGTALKMTWNSLTGIDILGSVHFCNTCMGIF